MQAPECPANEAQRLAALHALALLDTAAEDRFDRLTRLARRLFGVPIALLSLVDRQRQWFKSRQGMDVAQTPRSVSFCGHAVLANDLLVVEDATADDRFADNPMVLGEPHVRFYAGRPLRSPDGQPIGTLCIIDRRPRTLSDSDRQALNDLADVTESTLFANRLALEDSLTGIANRCGFDRLARQTLAICQRERLPASLLFFDLDRFKEINDRHGHAAGDEALKVFARLLTQTFRASDLCARVGGDEFVVLAPAVRGDATQAAIERLRAGVARYNREHGRAQPLAFSVGVATSERPAPSDLPRLMSRADVQMYRDKVGAPTGPEPVGADLAIDG